MMQGSGGVTPASTTATPGTSVEVQISNGAGTAEITVFGGPDSTETVTVPADGRITVDVPPDAGEGTFVIVSTGDPPASTTIEVVTTGS